MKKVLFPLIALVLVLGLALPMAAPAGAHMEGCPFTTDLLAGQTEDVGDVSVWNDGTNVYVQYVVDDPWVMTGSHLYVGKSDPNTIGMWSTPGQLPYSPGMEKSPSPGASYEAATMTYTIPLDEIYAYKFESKGKKGKGNGLTTDGDPGVEPCNEIYIAAHADVMKVIGEGCEDPFWATGVVDNSQGKGWTSGGTAVDVAAERSDPNEALGAPDASGPPWSGFYSLGLDGDIIVDFGYPIYNSDGDYDISVHEISGNRGDPTEDAEVYVMVDGVAHYAGLVKSSDQGNGIGTASIPDEFTYVDAVKLVDTTNKSWHVSLGYAGDGYDVDAVDACYLVEQEETAWGDGDPFGTNWATYFEYHMQFPMVLNGTGNYTAEWETDPAKSLPCSIHLATANFTGPSADEGRIVITMPDGTTLDDIEAISWWTYLVSGYVPHVDLILDCSENGIQDHILVAEGAYQNGDLTTGWASLSWFKTFSGVTAAYPSWSGLTGTPNLTQIDGTTAVWLSPAPSPPGPPDQLSIAKLSDYQSVAGLYGVSGSTIVLALEIEVDNWVVQSEVYVDDIEINLGS